MSTAPRDWVVESSTSILRREPWLQVFEEHIRLPDGRRVDDFYTIQLRNFVAVAALTEAGQMLFVNHYRHGPRGMTRSLPSGFIEAGEAPADAARRELLEETGHVADSWEALGSWVVDGNRRCGEEHVFLARGARRVAEPTMDDLAEARSEEHTSELQSHVNLVCRLLLEKKKNYAAFLTNSLGEHFVESTYFYPTLIASIT